MGNRNVQEGLKSDTARLEIELFILSVSLFVTSRKRKSVSIPVADREQGHVTLIGV
jgi:hypothetical protein